MLDHIAQRQQESPDYYDRMPDLSGKSSWQQLDTTICMRVLLDPEKDAEKASGSAGKHQQPGCSRRACNTVRTARNEAAHATDQTDAAQAAILFNEAVECVEDAYAGTAFRENELARYYRQAEEFLSRCGAKEPVASSRAPAEESLPPAVHLARAQGSPRAAKRQQPLFRQENGRAQQFRPQQLCKGPWKYKL